MGYTKLPFGEVQDADLKLVLHNANMYLADVYGILWSQRISDWQGGRGNFVACLALLCAIDGLARKEFPEVCNDDGQRFKKYIRERLGRHGCWPKNIGPAAKRLYTVLRNYLVHQLGVGEVTGQMGLTIWGDLLPEFQSAEYVEGLTTWPKNCPIFSDAPSADHFQETICVAGLYWAVKQAAKEMCN